MVVYKCLKDSEELFEGVVIDNVVFGICIMGGWF